MKIVLVASAILSALWISSGVAHADVNDTEFLKALKSEGIIDHISPKDAIAAGHTVCQRLDAGRTPTQVATNVLLNSDMPAYDSGFFVGASMEFYCPQYVT